MIYQLEKPVTGIIHEEKYQCSIEWRNGKFISDEPVSAGGRDAGPDPFTLLLSSVASCALITLRMYIDRKNWEIPSITVRANLYTEKINEVPTTVIDRDIIFGEPVSEEQKAKLLEIVKLCPISKLLEQNIKLRNFLFHTGETKTIRYANEEITVVWKPAFCEHSTRCWKQLPQVFRPSVKKWIDPNGASPERIEEQVARCPSGALEFLVNEKTTLAT